MPFLRMLVDFGFPTKQALERPLAMGKLLVRALWKVLSFSKIDINKPVRNGAKFRLAQSVGA